MLCKGYDRVLELANGDMIELRNARGTTLRVTKGVVWITQQDDTRDVVLHGGDVWTVERDGLTLIEAQDATLLCIVGAAAAASAHSRTRRMGVADRFRNWLESLANDRAARRSVPYY